MGSVLGGKAISLLSHSQRTSVRRPSKAFGTRIYQVSLALLVLSLGLGIGVAGEPTKVIFDTDIGGDIDDAGALAVLHHLADLGDAEILATIYTSSAEENSTQKAAGLIDAINTWYGRGDIPIGANKGPDRRGKNNYVDEVGGNQALYGHDVKTISEVPDMVTLYRQVLDAKPDRSVVICTVGSLVGLHHLMLSKAGDDGVSRSGIDLIKAKVKYCVAMGGRYYNEEGIDSNFETGGMDAFLGGVLERWPVDMYVSPDGYDIHSGGSLDNAPETNPVRRAFEVFRATKNNNPKLFPDDGRGVLNYHKSYDQIAVLFAVRGNQDGCFRIDKGYRLWYDGQLRREQQDSGRYHYIYVDISDDRMGKIIDDMTAAPPGNKR